ncbi:MAG: alpha/beta hydrolase [Phycisphaeraceae bacterium]|nr:alpha/beta hydrolase [Phycisphaeraceae bacterium]
MPRIEVVIVVVGLLALALFATTALGQARMVQPESLEQGFIIVVTDKSKTASANSPIFMASSHNGWNPADQKMKLTPRSDMRWQIIWEKPKLDSRIGFKFTRGNWDTVEVAPDFADIDNRLLPEVDATKLAPGEKPVIELEIETWRDKRAWEPAQQAANPYREIKVSAGTLRRLDVAGGGIVTRRDLLVWLPPGYDDPANAQRRYPVLYMQDGQNLFEKHPGIPAEWGMDETAARLIAEQKIEPLIIVGIPHAGAARASEYLPLSVLDGVEPRGKQYIEFLSREVIPRVERAFRVRTGRDSRGIGGASLGGLIALEAATELPGTFGKVLAESVPLPLGNNAVFRHFGAKPNWPLLVYFGMGGREAGDNAAMNERYTDGAGAFKELLAGRGLAAARARVVIDETARHDEAAWAARLPAALQFLFPPQVGAR